MPNETTPEWANKVAAAFDAFGESMRRNLERQEVQDAVCRAYASLAKIGAFLQERHDR